MTKAFEDRLTETHNQMQLQVQEITDRITQEKQMELDTLAKDHEWKEQELRQECEFNIR